MYLAKNVKYLRKRLGLNQEDLADLIPTSQNAIYKIEADKTLNPRFILKLAEVLNCTPNDLKYKDLVGGQVESVIKDELPDTLQKDVKLSEELKDLIAILVEREQKQQLSKELIQTLTFLASKTNS